MFMKEHIIQIIFFEVLISNFCHQYKMSKKTDCLFFFFDIVYFDYNSTEIVSIFITSLAYAYLEMTEILVEFF